MSAPPVWLLVLLGLLLGASALVSASETALFSLGRARAREAGRAAELLVARPRDLLVAVLLADLVLNLLFFLFARRLAPPGERGAWITALGSLVAVVVFGDILPKVVALRASVRIARLGAPALLVLVAAFGPVRRVLVLLLEGTTRALGPLAREERGLTADELGDLLERSARHGHLRTEEADLLYEVVELRSIRVREIMTPRVDALFLQVDGSNRADVVARAVERRQTWLPVVDGNPDRVVGRALVRELLTRPSVGPRVLVQPVMFAPEVASCLDLLHTLRERGAAEAVVVDEWGGTAGVVNLENALEEIVGDLRAEGEARESPVVPLGGGRYRVDGGLSIRDWNEHFDQNVVPSEFETVGGLVTALLGRIPRAGDSARFGDLCAEVEQVRGRRVVSVVMGVEAQSA